MWNFSSACYVVTEAWVTSLYLFYALETNHPYSLVKISVQQLNTDKISFSINITLHLTYRSHYCAPSNIPKGLESFLEPALRTKKLSLGFYQKRSAKALAQLSGLHQLGFIWVIHKQLWISSFYLEQHDSKIWKSQSSDFGALPCQNIGRIYTQSQQQRVDMLAGQVYWSPSQLRLFSGVTWFRYVPKCSKDDDNLIFKVYLM